MFFIRIRPHGIGCTIQKAKRWSFFDFERAEIIDSRPTLGIISPNRKRKLIPHDELDKKLPGRDFAREINEAVQELRGWKI